MPPPNLVVSIPFEEWLTLTGKGISQNASYTFPVGNTSQRIDPPQSQEVIIIFGVQFDGVLSGQVTFELRGGGQSVIAGYAMQGFIQDEILVAEPGLPIKLNVNNGQAQACVVNIDYVSVQLEVWKRDILPYLAGALPQFGGR